MGSLKLGLAATAMICALSATAQAADCVRVAVAGESLTHDIAVLFSTNGLKNIIYGQGRVGAHPGGNVTGVSMQWAELGPKEIELLREAPS
jgi:hypothetical protein